MLNPGDLIVWHCDARDQSCSGLVFANSTESDVSCTGVFLLISITETQMFLLSSCSRLVIIYTMHGSEFYAYDERKMIWAEISPERIM